MNWLTVDGWHRKRAATGRGGAPHVGVLKALAAVCSTLLRGIEILATVARRQACEAQALFPQGIASFFEICALELPAIADVVIFLQSSRMALIATSKARGSGRCELGPLRFTMTSDSVPCERFRTAEAHLFCHGDISEESTRCCYII